MGTSLVILRMLESRLNEKIVTLCGLIVSDKEIVSELQYEEESAQNTLEKLRLCR
jgi:hypothetical protein